MLAATKKLRFERDSAEKMVGNILTAFVRQVKPEWNLPVDTCVPAAAKTGGRDMRENRYITDFYNHYDEDGRLALRHGSVEFLTTMRYIEKYLRPGCRVLKWGPEPGAIPMRWPAVDIP